MATIEKLVRARRRRLSTEELKRLLVTTATTSERVRGLIGLGIHVNQIAACTRVSVSAVRNWSTGNAEPRADAAITLDDLRTTAKALLDRGMEPARVAQWLTSRDPERFGEDRPLDLLSTRPMEVLSAALGDMLDEEIAAADAEDARAAAG